MKEQIIKDKYINGRKFIFIWISLTKISKSALTPSLPKLSNIYVQPFATHTHTYTCPHKIICTHANFHSVGYLPLKYLKYSYTHSSHTYKQIHAHTHTHTHAYTLTHIHMLFV